MISPDSFEFVLQRGGVFDLDRNKRVLVVDGHNVLEHGLRSSLVIVFRHEADVISVHHYIRFKQS